MSTTNTAPPPPPEPAPEERKRRPHKRPFEIGQVLGTTFRLWGRNLVPLFLLALITFLPLVAYYLWIRADVIESVTGPEAGDFNPLVASGWGEWISLVLGPLLTTLLAAPVVGMVVAQLRGRNVSLGASLRPGMARLGPAFAVAFIVALIGFAFVWIGEQIHPQWGQLVVFVPQMIVACGLFVAVPAIVIERPGIFGALGRSWQLTNGNKIRIFVVLLLLGLVLGIATTAITAILLRMHAGGAATWIGIAVVTAITGSVSAVFSGVVYHDLRVAVDGVDPEEIAAVFD